MNHRQSTILNYVTEHGEAKNAELLALIGDYSAMTLWRDLSKLEQEGQLVRTRGGAIAVQESGVGREANFTLRSKQNISAKEEISKIASELLHENHAYYLDAGSTIFTLTRYLREGHYNIITSAANTATELAHRNGYNVTLLGGQISGSTLSTSGPQAEEMLRGMNIDIAVMATSGFSVGGDFTSGCLPEARLKKQVIAKSAFTVMLMDFTKIARSLPFTFSTLDEVDVLIGDSQLTEDFVHTAQSHNVCVFTPNDGRTVEERYQLYHELFTKKYR